jgi:hypothetical protein
MAHGDISGYARTDPRNPRAFAVCDGCGAWYNRYALHDQYDWAGDALIDLNLRVCHRCLDKPQEQFRTVILPQDPTPIDDPRPEYPHLNDNLNGFVKVNGPQIGQLLGDFSFDFGPDFQHLLPNPNRIPIGTALDPNRPFLNVADVFGSSYTGWGNPIPTSADGSTWLLTLRNGQIAISGVAQLLAPPNPSRTWLMIYNPAQALLAVAQGTPVIGMPSTMIVGTGEAILQNALTTPPGPIWRSAIYAVGLIAGAPYFALEG